MTTMTRRALLAAPALFQAAAQRTSGSRLDPPTAKVQAVLDTDTYNEIDDQFAVCYALRSPARIELEAIYAAPFFNDRSTSAGDGMQKSYEEIGRILERLDVSSRNFAYRGSEAFMPAANKPVKSAAAEDLIAKALKPRTGPLYVVSIGAPTNVASAILMEPRIKDSIVVVWLGGQPFDWNTASEFNLKQDIHASRVLYDSGVPLIDIPTTNVSEHLRTTVPEMEKSLKGKSSIADYLLAEFVEYAKQHAPSAEFPYSKVIWDISTVAWLVEPKWIPSRLAPSPVLTSDLKYESAPGRHTVRVAIHADRDQIFNDLFKKLAR
jgi:purine nucleosidase